MIDKSFRLSDFCVFSMILMLYAAFKGKSSMKNDNESLHKQLQRSIVELKADIIHICFCNLQYDLFIPSFSLPDQPPAQPPPVSPPLQHDLSISRRSFHLST